MVGRLSEVLVAIRGMGVANCGWEAKWGLGVAKMGMGVAICGWEAK